KELGRFRESENVLEAGQQLMAQLVLENPQSAHDQTRRAQGLGDLADRRRAKGDLEGALKLQQEAVSHGEAAVKLASNNPTHRLALSLCYSNLAETLNRMRRHDEALKFCKRHRAVVGQLVQEYPRVPVYLHEQIIGYSRQADALEALNRDGDAQKVYRE